LIFEYLTIALILLSHFLGEAKSSSQTVADNFHAKVKVIGTEVGHLESFAKAGFKSLDIGHRSTGNKKIIHIDSNDYSVPAEYGRVCLEWLESLIG
jgi:hypothetical protein